MAIGNPIVPRRFRPGGVIVITGEVTIESALKALRRGAYDYLRKPFESTDFVNTIDNALSRVKLERQHNQAEEKLRESEARYRQLFESESDAVLVFDVETLKIEDANQAALKLFGYSKAEILKLVLTGISAEKQKTATAVKLLRTDTTSITRIPLRYLEKKDGSTFPAEISTGAFVSDGRKKIIGAVRDITDRKKTEGNPPCPHPTRSPNI